MRKGRGIRFRIRFVKIGLQAIVLYRRYFSEGANHAILQFLAWNSCGHGNQNIGLINKWYFKVIHKLRDTIKTEFTAHYMKYIIDNNNNNWSIDVIETENNMTHSTLGVRVYLRGQSSNVMKEGKS